MRNNNSERMLQGVRYKASRPKEDQVENQYNLKILPKKRQQSPQSPQQKLRSSTKKVKAESLLYHKMQQKLQTIESKIQEIKANIHRKNLERMKKNVLRSQELEELRRKYRERQDDGDGIGGRGEKENLGSSEAKRDDIKIQMKKEQKIQPSPIPFQNSNKSLEEQTKSPSLASLITQAKPPPISIPEPSFKPTQTLKGLVTSIPEDQQKHAFETNPYSPRSSIYYVSEVIKGYRDQTSLVREHIKTSIILFNYFSAMRMPSNAEVKKRAVDLPQASKYKGKKTIIFDLDQTLIHCNDSLKIPHQIKLPVHFPTGETITAGINIRPGASEILSSLAPHFQLIVFTASHSSYANVVIDYLDPNRQWIQHRLYREHCFLTKNGEYVKDLRIINRELKDCVLVDNAAYSYAFQPENGIPIIPYYHGDKDYELKMLTQYIKKLELCSDVRVVNRLTFQLTKYRNYSDKDIEKLVQDLYINKTQ